MPAVLPLFTRWASGLAEPLSTETPSPVLTFPLPSRVSRLACAAVMVAASHLPGQPAAASPLPLAVPPVLVRSAAVASPVPAPPPAVHVGPPPVPIGQRVLDWALTQRGVPYVFAATGPWGYDCSGLALAAWRTVGVQLPRVAAAQFDAGPHVPLAQAQPGDLVFYGGSWGIFHVAIYLGGGMMVEAPHSGGVVQVAPLGTDGTPLPVVTRPAD